MILTIPDMIPTHSGNDSVDKIWFSKIIEVRSSI